MEEGCVERRTGLKEKLKKRPEPRDMKATSPWRSPVLWLARKSGQGIMFSVTRNTSSHIVSTPPPTAAVEVAGAGGGSSSSAALVVQGMTAEKFDQPAIICSAPPWQPGRPLSEQCARTLKK